MKKLTILISLLLLFSVSYAQKGKVRSAYSNYQNGNVLKAKQQIDAATVHVKTMNDATTWLYRGNIYIGVYNANSDILVIDEQALAKAADAFAKTIELDTEKEYVKEINDGYVSLAAATYNEAVKAYNAKTYKVAGIAFADAYTYAKMGTVIDTNSIYNCAISYNLAKMPKEADKYYELLVAMNYDKATIYSEYSDILSELENQDKAFEVIAKGRELYPRDYSILIAEANLFLKTDQTDKALVNLEEALSFESANYSIYHAIGAMYNMIFVDTAKTEVERFSAYDKAVDAYTKVKTMEPTYFDAIYNLGAIIFNKGVYFIDKADALPFGDKNYESLLEEGQVYLVDALPFLEEALALNPDDTKTLFSLKQVYLRTKNMEKYKVVNERLKELEELEPETND